MHAACYSSAFSISANDGRCSFGAQQRRISAQCASEASSGRASVHASSRSRVGGAYGRLSISHISTPNENTSLKGISLIALPLAVIPPTRRPLESTIDTTYGDGPAAQAQEIIKAQLAPVAAPLISAVPAGTTLRALYVTSNGAAYVDLSREVVNAHPGGSLDELLTIYSIVNALTMNLPAVTSVQVLVDGKETDTLAGHVDLRRPLTKNVSWVE